LGDEGLCVFVRPPVQDASPEQIDSSRPAELFVRSYGRGTELAKYLIEQTKAWDVGGRPSSKGLRIRAYPKDADFVSAADEFVVSKEWSQLVLGWE
jgi:hypothetical protein